MEGVDSFAAMLKGWAPTALPSVPPPTSGGGPFHDERTEGTAL